MDGIWPSQAVCSQAEVCEMFATKLPIHYWPIGRDISLLFVSADPVPMLFLFFIHILADDKK